MKIRTAVGKPEPVATEVGYINCFGSPQVRPTSLTLDCVADSRRLTDITWTQWTATRAEGVATLIDAETATLSVPVTLSAPLGGSFTDLTVDGELAYP